MLSRWVLGLCLSSIVVAQSVPSGGLGPALPANVTADVSPYIVPPGGDLWLAVTNESTLPVTLSSGCPYVITTITGALVFTPACPAATVTVAPGARFTTTWNSRDQFGALVPDGLYYLMFTTPNGQTLSYSFQINSAYGVGLAQRASLIRGKSAGLAIAAPGYPSGQYVAAASGSTITPLATCSGPLYLQLDPLFFFSTAPNNTIFLNMSGALANNGRTVAPSIFVPNNPQLAGFTFVMCAVIYQPSATCPFPAISGPTQLSVL
jgi:hypothetical protein